MSEPSEPANDAEEPACGGPTPFPSLAGEGGETEDPEVAALLEFEPVPRIYKRRRAWTGELQREFIARLAVLGSVNKACHEMGKDPGGIRRLKTAPGSESFRASWNAAEELWERRNPLPPPEPPGAGRRNRTPPLPAPSPARGEGQVLNEYGEWEDEDSLHRRAEDARDSISNKLLRIRRLFLRDISDCPGKRAAFEILTEYPVDWEKAEQVQPQLDEPFRKPNMRDPDIVLAAEAGWFGELAHGRNRWAERKAELQRALDEYHAEHGLPPIGWDDQQPECRGALWT